MIAERLAASLAVEAEQIPVGKERRRLDDVLDGHAIRRQDGAQIGEGLTDLCRGVAGNRTIRRDAHLAGNDQTAVIADDLDRVRVARWCPDRGGIAACYCGCHFDLPVDDVRFIGRASPALAAR